MRTQEAAGFIETLGYLAAVEAADVCLKTANVSLVAMQNATGGLITIIVRGDVGATKAAIEAGTMAADRVGTVVSTHVIARPAEELDRMLRSWQPVRKAENSDASEPLVEVAEAAEQAPLAEPDQHTTIALDVKEVSEEVTAEPTEDALLAMRTVDLRNQARQLSGFSMSKQQIKFAKKKELVQAIIEHRMREE